MNADVNIAATAALLADPTRASFLLALLDGRALTAGELARRARVSPSTASAHLAKLADGGLITLERSGRHHYVRLAGPAVAQALEAIASVAPPAPVRSLRESETGAAIRAARTCYDHLAGTLGVELTAAMLGKGILVTTGDGYDVTPKGVRQLRELGLEVARLKGLRRGFALRCLDWSERRHHVAGALGAAIAEALFERGWVKRTAASRAVVVTEAGRRGLAEFFDLHL